MYAATLPFLAFGLEGYETALQQTGFLRSNGNAHRADQRLAPLIGFDESSSDECTDLRLKWLRLRCANPGIKPLCFPADRAHRTLPLPGRRESLVLLLSEGHGARRRSVEPIADLRLTAWCENQNAARVTEPANPQETSGAERLAALTGDRQQKR